MRRTWRTLATLLALVVVLAGCTGDDSSGFDPVGETMTDDDAAAPAPTGGGEEAALTDESGAAEDGVEQPVVDAGVAERKVIRTGEMAIRASDTRRAMERITDLVESSGGYVASSTVSPAGEGEQPMVSITVRVPAGELSTALSSIRELADEVVSESIQSQDVTEEYTDVESRLRNLTALETELVALLAEVREQPDADPQKLLQVFEEIGRVRGEIEVLEGRRRLLDDRTSLSTITVNITAPPVEAPIVEDEWQPLLTVRRAAGDLLGTLQSFADGALWLLIYALPVLAILALPIWLLVKLASRRSSRKPPSPPPPPPPPPPPAPAPATAGPPAGETD